MIISKPNIKYSLEEIVGMDISGRSILVIGPPASGKTFLCNKLAQKTNMHRIIHTDSYSANSNWESGLYELIKDISTIVLPSIIEGCLGYRLLRKGAEGECAYSPDIIINCNRSRAQMEETYLKERDQRKIKYLKSFHVGNLKVLSDYYRIMNFGDNKLPEMIDWYNNH